MSGKLAIMAGLAAIFGTTSYYAGNQYLEGQAQARLVQIESTAIETTKIVVADENFSFGDEIDEKKLRIVTWPKESLPEGFFSDIKSVIGSGQRRVLKSIAKNEPLLAAKLTGEDGRGGLSGIISEGMRAVTIPVDSVKGVGGFIQPGDFVDIVFSQRERKTGKQVANILMENVKVLTVDQNADVNSTAAIAKTVTLETDANGAQKIALASEVGRLSLLLRSVGDQSSVSTSSITLGNEPSQNEEGQTPDTQDDGGFMSLLKLKATTKSIRVVRGDDVHHTTVPIYDEMENN